jgi:hypothetical protein
MDRFSFRDLPSIAALFAGGVALMWRVRKTTALIIRAHVFGRVR